LARAAALKRMRLDGQPGRRFALAQNLQPIDGPVDQSGLAQTFHRDLATRLELGQGTHVDRQHNRAIRRVEAALGHAPDQAHLTAFEGGLELVTRAGVLTLGAAAGGLAVAGASPQPNRLVR
jgi:hypothetical protein